MHANNRVFEPVREVGDQPRGPFRDFRHPLRLAKRLPDAAEPHQLIAPRQRLNDGDRTVLRRVTIINDCGPRASVEIPLQGLLHASGLQ